MGYIKEPTGIDFVVESKNWTEAEKEDMRAIIARKKASKSKRMSAVRHTNKALSFS
jgi:hypothetical protein